MNLGAFLMGVPAILLTLAVPVLAQGAPEDRAPGDSPLREGVARYHYYQQEYLPSLAELMVARERGQWASADQAVILEGAIRLAFGMPESARQRFEQSFTHRPAQRDAAYFYLGKLHYLRGEWDKATAAWARLDDALAPDLAREQQALEWQMAIRRGNLPDTETKQLWRQLDDWAPAILYNLGGANARAGERARARHYYRALTDEAPRRHWSSDEYWAWVDRAHTATGFIHLLEGNFEAAEDAFALVRLKESAANRALLGYGWAAASRGDYREALRPWQALSKRSLTEASVHEVLLAVPHAYEQLGARAAAMTAYDRAEGLLENELSRVRQLQDSLSGEQLLRYFQTRESGAPLSGQARENWLSLTRATVAFSADAYLDEWVNRSQFQAQVQALSDLQDQHARLAQWRPKLGHYRQLLHDKQQLRRERGAEVERRSLFEQADTLEQQREPLARRLESIRAERDYLALANDDQQSLYAMTERAREAADRLEAAGEDIGDSRKRIRMYRGILLWRSAQAFPANLWQAQKQLNGLDGALEQLAQNRQRVRTIVNQDPDIRPSLDRIAHLEGRIEQQLAALDAALDRRAQTLADDLQDHLGRHRQRLNHYLARTRLAAARVQDEALHGDSSVPEVNP